MKFNAKTFQFLITGLLFGSSQIHAEETLASRLSKDIEEISRSAVPTIEPVKKQICATAAATLTRHVNLQPGAISTAVYRSSQTLIHVQWDDFEFHSFQPTPIVEADRLNGVTASYRINFNAKAYRTWKSGDPAWSKWKASRYKTFSYGITIEMIKGRWATKPDPRLNFFSPGPGTPAVTKPSSTSAPTLPPGMSRQP